jgi:hypothetical protein
MHCNENGISLSRLELTALLDIASKEPSDRNRYGVLFRVDGDRCYARATNGEAMSVEAVGDSDAQHSAGEWFVHRDLLVNGKKLVTGKQVLRLQFSGASLNTVRVEENGVEISELHWPTDAAVAQASFPTIDDSIKLPASNRKMARCAAANTAYLVCIDKVAKAAGVEFADLYPPKDKEGALVFRAGDDGERDTIWTGSIRPVPSNASSKAEEEPDDEAAE